MNDVQRLEAMDSYFNRYRKLMSRLKQNDQENDTARKAYDQRRTELQEERRRLSHDLASMRQVITRMIDEGIDPVMAGLIMNEEDEQKEMDIWQVRDQESFGVTMSDHEMISSLNSNLGLGQISPNMSLNLSSIYSMHGTSGATGATGAIGSISMGPNGGYQQGYGAIPPQHTHPGVTADWKAYDSGNGYDYSVQLEP